MPSLLLSSDCEDWSHTAHPGRAETPDCTSHSNTIALNSLLIKYKPFGADSVNFGKSCQTLYKWPLLQQHTDKPTEELTVLMQLSPQQEFVTVFLEPKNSPFSSFRILSRMLQQLPKPHPALLQDKLDLISHSEQKSGQSHTGKAVKHMKAVGQLDVFCLLEQLLWCVSNITAVLLTVSPLQPELQITHREENAKTSGKMQTQIM